ncbi:MULTISPECIES: DUF4834 family protein [Flavobacteriaceae]|uniref:DUF4834 family protein n=1 Tax=Flavobacteriaceae TaxID=49546 RepID=UPI0010AED53B|nr:MULTISPECIES: DUF4834 family protein [Flavobacteriaceae]NJB35506.1 DUF4834 family protein [Croceivirga sp. JEA036]TKD66190.1 DUF4834 family protein [Flavobacterium sp. ASW18X]
MVLLQTILILIIVYYGIKFLLKLFMPNIIRYASKKAEEKFGQQFGGFQQRTAEHQEEGKTTVYKKSNTKSNPSKKVGEYIEFEEIE